MSLEVVEAARSSGISFQINTTVSKETLKTLPEVAKLALNLGAEMWDLFFIVPTGRAKREEIYSEFEVVKNMCIQLSR